MSPQYADRVGHWTSFPIIGVELVVHQANDNEDQIFHITSLNL
jgi:hypothetical protein